MVKKRTYNVRLVKENYTYTVEQIADLFGIDVATVRRWIKDEGLERIPKTRPFLIHSSALKSFLTKKKAKRKKPTLPDEVYCCKCRVSRTPKKGSAKIKSQPNGALFFQAKCAGCKGKINKAIKLEDWSEKHPLAAYLHDAMKQHNGKHSSHRKCQLQEGEQLCLNLTP
ncbi:MAG: helix-turn-helix domain-containing protein [Alphaproteobacteria bacterium]|nr:helix-turn-helix domain-containing protein [Alphaproteobacteria bacterium]QQS57840.1 MAG: helix-turn-helix domain-containing protein [Alphaproteobacteria bacterium]